MQSSHDEIFSLCVFLKFVMADGNGVQAGSLSEAAHRHFPTQLAHLPHDRHTSPRPPWLLTSPSAPRSSPSYPQAVFPPACFHVSGLRCAWAIPACLAASGIPSTLSFALSSAPGARLMLAHGDSQFHQHEALMTPRAPRNEMLAITALTLAHAVQFTHAVSTRVSQGTKVSSRPII
jgi:hypothetical protein